MVKTGSKPDWVISIGNFLFKHRDYVFPLYIGVLFFIFKPPGSTVLGSEWFETMQDVLGVVFTLAGLSLRSMVIGFAYIQRGGKNKKVYAESLVTQGVFALCRNPLYVGNMLIYLGVFIMFGNMLCLAIGAASFAFVYYSLVATEENFLKQKFGKEYEAYCGDVPRWIPRFSRFKEATQGMHFDWKKVIERDHGTICIALGVLVLIEFWEVMANYGFKNNEIYSIFSLVLCALLVSAVLLVRKLKKAGYL